MLNILELFTRERNNKILTCKEQKLQSCGEIESILEFGGENEVELLFEIIFELVVGGSIEGANDNELPKVVRICLLIFATLIYIAFTAFFVWLLWSSENVFVKILAAGIVMLFVGVLISLWCKVLKARK